MGVDAEMLVAVPQVISERELKRLGYEMCCAFGAHQFWISRDPEKPRYPLTFDLSWLDGVGDETWTRFRVSLGGRFYGPGYERGNWPLYMNLRRWFLTKLPGCKVFYGGDTSEWIPEFTHEMEAEFWQHFANVQHHPYNKHPHDGDGLDNRRCEFCDELMERNGWGPCYAAFHCDGCGIAEETKDGGVTWGASKW